MPVTETQVARRLRKGLIDVDTVLQLFYDGDVLVYAPVDIDPTEATWGTRENMAMQTSGIMGDLRNAGATNADLAEVSVQIQRAQDAGRTIESHYGFVDTEPNQTLDPATVPPVYDPAAEPPA